MQLYDSLGAAQSLNSTDTPTATPVLPDGSAGTTWTISSSVTGGGTVSAGLPQSVSFNQSGQFAGYTNAAATYVPVAPAAGYTNPSLTISGWTDGAAPNTTTWLLTSPTGAGNNLTPYLSSFASSSCCPARTI